MQVWNFCFTLGWGCRISRLHNFGPMRPWFALAINSSPTGTFIFVCFPELPWEMHTKIQLPWEQRGFPVCCWWLPCLDPSSPHTTGQRCSVVACPHVASAGQSVCCGWMNPVVGASHPMMEITPGPRSQERVMVSLLLEAAVWMRVWRAQRASNLGPVFGSGREGEAGLLFTMGIGPSTHPRSHSCANLPMSAEVAPPCLRGELQALPQKQGMQQMM